MTPLSKNKRRFYFGSFVVFFALTIPMLLLYAIGYQFNFVYGVVKTGGVYVNTYTSGAAVYLSGTLEKTTNIFQHNFLIGNLEPKTYDISVSKDGYVHWSKKVQVFGEQVTDVYALLLPTKIASTTIAQYLMPDGSEIASTTKISSVKNKILNPEYIRVSNLFATTTNYTALLPVKSGLGTTTNLVVKNKIAFWSMQNNLHVRWLGDINDIPAYFCIDQMCKNELVFTLDQKISHIDVYPGNEHFVLLTLPTGVFAYDIDAFNIDAKGIPIVESNGIDFRVGTDGNIYIKDASFFSFLII